MHPSPILTILICCLVGFTSYKAFYSTSIFMKYHFNIGSILQNKEWYRTISSGFLHADGMHLAFNLFCFYSFASNIELYYGWLTLLIIYALSLVGGSMASIFIQKGNPHYTAVGASGAVSGVMFSSIFLLPGGSIGILFIPIGIPSWIFALLYTIYSIYGIYSQKDRIGHEAHLGGAITGMVTAFLLFPSIVLESQMLFVTLLFMVIVATLYFILNPIHNRWH